MDEDAMRWLWPHQEEAIKWAWDRQAILLHHEMGCGKTRTALEFIRRWFAEHGGSRVLVCCPKAVIAAWVKQAGLWFPDIRVVALDRGTGDQKAKQVTAALADLSPVIVVVNYESAWRIKPLEKQRWDILVWDEVHRLKSASGVASRWAGRMCKSNPSSRRIGLSGTLIPHSILDAYGIWRAVESPDCQTFGTTYTLHKAKYAVIAPHQNFVVGYKNLPEAHQKIATTTHRAKAADVLELPKINFIDTPVELTAKEAKLYRELETEFCAVVEQGVVTPANALVQLLRLQQVCGGYCKFDGEPEAKAIVSDGAKGAALADMLEDFPADEPIVIFCRFRSDIQTARRAAEASGRKVSELSGTKNELADWQQAKTSVLVCQIQSGGIGIDLTRAAYCAFFSLGYSVTEYYQAVARLHRPGQERPVFIYHLIATILGRQTMDGRVYEALRERKEVIDVIVDGIRTSVAAIGAR
jgi:SNF2 family DNA or RNA helicase